MQCSMFGSTTSKRLPVACGALLVAGLIVAGCGSDSVLDPGPDPDPDPGPPAVSLDASQPVLAFADFSAVGTSLLERTANGVNYELSTSGLEAGHAYTLWIVIFNDTDGCEDGTEGFALCGPMDVVNPAARPDMMFAAGTTVGNAGTATFIGRRAVDDGGGSANGPVGLPAHGLEAPFGAEFHMVVHDHGPLMSEYMPDMILTIDGGCTDSGVPEPGAPSPWNDHDGPGVGAFGVRGPNTCLSVQFAVHSP